MNLGQTVTVDAQTGRDGLPAHMITYSHDKNEISLFLVLYTYMNTYILTYIQIYIYIYVYIYIYTYIHTYIYIYIERERKFSMLDTHTHTHMTYI